MTATM